MIQALKLANFLGQLLAACVGHHIHLPDQDIWFRLQCRRVRCFDIGLHIRTVFDVDEDERLDLAIGEKLRSPRSECAIGARDHDGLPFVRLGGHCELGVSLLPEVLPWEELRQDPLQRERDDDNRESHGRNWPVLIVLLVIVHFGDGCDPLCDN